MSGNAEAVVSVQAESLQRKTRRAKMKLKMAPWKVKLELWLQCLALSTCACKRHVDAASDMCRVERSGLHQMLFCGKYSAVA